MPGCDYKELISSPRGTLHGRETTHGGNYGIMLRQECSHGGQWDMMEVPLAGWLPAGGVYG